MKKHRETKSYKDHREVSQENKIKKTSNKKDRIEA